MEHIRPEHLAVLKMLIELLRLNKINEDLTAQVIKRLMVTVGILRFTPTFMPIIQWFTTFWWRASAIADSNQSLNFSMILISFRSFARARPPRNMGSWAWEGGYLPIGSSITSIKTSPLKKDSWSQRITEAKPKPSKTANSTKISR